MSGIRIDELNPTVLPSEDHEFAAMKDGLTVKLSVSQVIALTKAAILDGAPEALDTLNELAAALNDDAAFSSTVTNSLAQKLSLFGGTMAGNIDMASNAISNISSLNGGPLGGFRNKIINGNFVVNQRGGTKTPGIGVYGYDRWKGHANGLEQVIENLEAGTYTLTFDGGGTGSVDGLTAQTSPATFNVAATGDISVVVPSTVTKVSLVKGDAINEDDPFEFRNVALEILLCYRYYLKEICCGAGGYAEGSNQTARCGMEIIFPVEMRTTPTTSYISDFTNANTNPFSGTSFITTNSMYFGPKSNGTGSMWWFGRITLDAEF